MRAVAWRWPLFSAILLLWLLWAVWTAWSLAVDPRAFAAVPAAAPFAAPVALDGAAIQGGVVRGRVAPGSRVWLRGEPLRVSAQGRFVFGFGRDEAGAAALEIEAPDGRRQRRSLLIAERRYAEQRIDGVPERTVTPPDAALSRIRDEAGQVRRARSADTAHDAFAGPFRWPLHGPITGVYGSQRFYNGQPRRPHFGVDIAMPAGTPVVSPAAGVVRLAHPDMFYSGGTVVIDHGHGLFSTMLHMDRVDVSVGDALVAGQRIGAVGAGGRATGPHLDWRVNWFAARLDPMLLAGPMPEAVERVEVR